MRGLEGINRWRSGTKGSKFDSRLGVTLHECPQKWRFRLPRWATSIAWEYILFLFWKTLECEVCLHASVSEPRREQRVRLGGLELRCRSPSFSRGIIYEIQILGRKKDRSSPFEHRHCTLGSESPPLVAWRRIGLPKNAGTRPQRNKNKNKNKNRPWG